MVQNVTLKVMKKEEIFTSNLSHKNIFMLTIVCEIFSLSISNSDKFLVPKTFLNVVAANRRVE